MPTLVIKSLPDDLHQRLKRVAAAHRRSLVPTYANALSAGAFADGLDSTTTISAARDER